MSETSNVIALYVEIDGKICPTEASVRIRRARSESRFDFLRGARLLEACLSNVYELKIKLRLETPASNVRAFAAAARECRVVRADRYGHTWIHEVMAATVEQGSGDHLVVLHLRACRETDVGRWDEDQGIGLGGKKIPLPPPGHLLVVSRGREMVSTDAFPILPVWKAS